MVSKPKREKRVGWFNFESLKDSRQIKINNNGRENKMNLGSTKKVEILFLFAERRNQSITVFCVML